MEVYLHGGRRYGFSFLPFFSSFFLFLSLSLSCWVFSLADLGSRDIMGGKKDGWLGGGSLRDLFSVEFVGGGYIAQYQRDVDLMFVMM